VCMRRLLLLGRRGDQQSVGRERKRRGAGAESHPPARSGVRLRRRHAGGRISSTRRCMARLGGSLEAKIASADRSVRERGPLLQKFLASCPFPAAAAAAPPPPCHNSRERIRKLTHHTNTLYYRRTRVVFCIRPTGPSMSHVASWLWPGRCGWSAAPHGVCLPLPPCADASRLCAPWTGVWSDLAGFGEQEGVCDGHWPWPFSIRPSFGRRAAAQCGVATAQGLPGRRKSV
jgi:hypothetical protein